MNPRLECVSGPGALGAGTGRSTRCCSTFYAQRKRLAAERPLALTRRTCFHAFADVNDRGRALCCQAKPRQTSCSKHESDWLNGDTSDGLPVHRLLRSVVAGLGAVSLLTSSCIAPGPAFSQPRLTSEEQLTIDIFKRSTPSVVNVTNLAIKRDTFTMNMLELPQGQGSGFVWDVWGHVVTNYHVIQDASDIKVTLADGEEFSARVVGVDPDKDIAVLQIGPLTPPAAGVEGDGSSRPQQLLAAPPLASPAGGQQQQQQREGTGTEAGSTASPPPSSSSSSPAPAPAAAVPPPPPLQLAGSQLQPLSVCSSSADLVVGQKVYAIGNPFGLDHTLTTGVVSGTGREIQSISGRPIQDVIQTDAAINPGNSGGPLLDSGGCLIGINTAIYSPTGANNGVGFAIPVDIVKSSVGQIIAYGKVTRPVLGISFAPDQSSEALGIKGILVLSAREGGPAWRAGLQGSRRDEYGRLVLGDIITAVNGNKIKSSSDLYRVLDKSQVGDTLRLTVLRENSTLEVSVTLEAGPAGGRAGGMAAGAGGQQGGGGGGQQQPQPGGQEEDGGDSD
ncbi:hypothetical protein Agub_g5865 [Astrephomene gubernaculifera]|uniref:PDZ domain-containing protein n=1 Tax=Astrephomene gubernaculifera TaxID=47775 RepID=A0AAD3DPZ7_9CHLO|nr:hypothetical protein Agub_g5865 [Astrephomene gubernaculifera]